MCCAFHTARYRRRNLSACETLKTHRSPYTRKSRWYARTFDALLLVGASCARSYDVYHVFVRLTREIQLQKRWVLLVILPTRSRAHRSFTSRSLNLIRENSLKYLGVKRSLKTSDSAVLSRLTRIEICFDVQFRRRSFVLHLVNKLNVCTRVTLNGITSQVTERHTHLNLEDIN